ncbi:hypothetical protein F5146DRAFT_1064361 [Armillaria mellea]|nr:hypothetical protein F5146DRAFT_1064361 [Armillaria mellea]
MHCDPLPFAQFFRELEPARRTSVTRVSVQSWGLRFKEICLLLDQFPSTDTLDLEGQTVKALESKAFVETFVGGPGLPIRRLDLRISQELIGSGSCPLIRALSGFTPAGCALEGNVPYAGGTAVHLLRVSSSLEECHITDEHISSTASLPQFEIRSDRAQRNRLIRVSHRALVAAQSCCCQQRFSYQTCSDFGRTLRIQYGVLEHGGVLSKFDAVLSAPSMASLKLVTIDISYRFTRLVSHLPRIQKDVNEAFVALRERQLLNFRSSRICSWIRSGGGGGGCAELENSDGRNPAMWARVSKLGIRSHHDVASSLHYATCLRRLRDMVL